MLLRYLIMALTIYAAAANANQPMDNDSSLIIPAPLKPGDRIAILSPAGAPRLQNVYKACEVLREKGWDPYLTSNATGMHGTYSGTYEQRLQDLRDALTDTTTRAIICTRGGYGAVHLLDSLNLLPLRQNAKWLVGFSDISALHALLNRHGIASIHGPMCKHISADSTRINSLNTDSIALEHPFNTDAESLFSLLEGKPMNYWFEPNALNRNGSAKAPLIGGNLAVLQGLISTPYDIFRPGVILFIEDIAEPVYKVERILYQLRMNGVLENLAGLIVGEFTDYTPDNNNLSMEEMISNIVGSYDFPVAFGIPVGHGERNTPLVEGVTATLEVSAEGVTLKTE